jgi:uncharacterized membrane protein
MPFRTRKRLLILGTALVLFLFAAIRFASPDGVQRAAILQFLGRFHPVSIHLPIALLFLVPLLELAAWFRNRHALQEAAGFVLSLATIAAFASAYLGVLLAWSGGYQGGLVSLHGWGGVWIPAGALICWGLRPNHRLFYGLALMATIALLVWTGDQGGKLAHGETYLTEYFPGRRKVAFKDTSVDPTSFYATRVQPIFNDKCVLCHNAEKFKGGLRLDGFSQAMRGGKDGPAIVPGDVAKSALIHRVTLPPQDKNFMPAEGKPPLTEAEIQLLQVWITAGATPDIPQTALQQLPAVPQAEKPAEPMAADYRPQIKTITDLEGKLGVHLVPRSQVPSDGLILRTATAPDRCTDETLRLLAPVAALIVDAELSRTKVTDQGLAQLATFPNLRFLDLSHTAVTSSGMSQLEKLPKLESLNLTETKVTPDGAKTLKAKSGLKKLYLFGSM